MRSSRGFWPGRWWRLSLLIPVCLLICSCATPAVSPAPDGAVERPGDTVETNETAPASEAIEHRTVLKPEADKNADASPQHQRERLERRLQAVVTCLEEARQAVVAAEVAGAGIEVVRPAIQALSRSEATLREAQAQLLRGDVAQAASLLDTAEAECHTAREFRYQI